MKTILCALALVMTLVGCASSSIVPEGPDSYVIYREAATGFQSAAPLRSQAVKEATEYCQKQGKHLRVTRSKVTPGGGVGQYPNAEVAFMCLSQADAAPPAQN